MINIYSEFRGPFTITQRSAAIIVGLAAAQYP